ncbi:MAG TPA: glycosyltransferase family 4 protein [Acidimicrobiales bacterium]|nr:glycosyltransferase family 4 protein [Acidimicrobiales bacterium]
MQEPIEPDGAAVAKIGDLAAAAGVRRIHVLAWRDLDDVEAGGSEIHIHEAARRWAAAGLEVTLRTSWAQGQPTEAIRDGYRVVRRAGRHMVFPRAAAAELFRRTGPRDVLVEIWNGMPFLSPLWNRGPRIVVIHHVHAEMWKMALGPRLGALGALFERKVAPPLYRRTTIVTVSESSKRELVDELGLDPGRIRVIPNGVDARYSPGQVAKETEPLVAAVGRLAPVKRYDALVRAADVARRRLGRPLRLEIVGEGFERPLIESVIDELDAGGWVTLRGSVSEPEKIDLYRRAWIIASASAREGWGLALTEAAACGTPAVASRIAGHGDAVIDGVSGMLVPGDPETLGAAMACVLGDHDLRARLGRGALERAAQLSWSAAATALMRVVADEVMTRRPPR